MMKMVLVVGAALIAVSSFAEPNESESKGKTNIRELIYKRTGGMLKIPNVQKGSIVFVNAQKAAPVEWIESIADTYAKRLRIEIVVKDGNFAFPSPAIQGDLSLFIVDDPAMPPVLFAPESRWAVVNVSGLRKGEGMKQEVFEMRCRKEFIRGFALLAGAQTSNYAGGIMLSVTDASDLDKMTDLSLPADVLARFPAYLERIGIKPYEMTSYRQACKEGWAASPTNDVQKKIWDEVHEIPTKPIKIEFDPKTDKK